MRTERFESKVELSGSETRFPSGKFLFELANELRPWHYVELAGDSVEFREREDRGLTARVRRQMARFFVLPAPAAFQSGRIEISGRKGALQVSFSVNSVESLSLRVARGVACFASIVFLWSFLDRVDGSVLWVWLGLVWLCTTYSPWSKEAFPSYLRRLAHRLSER